LVAPDSWPLQFSFDSSNFDLWLNNSLNLWLNNSLNLWLNWLEFSLLRFTQASKAAVAKVVGVILQLLHETRTCERCHIALVAPDSWPLQFSCKASSLVALEFLHGLRKRGTSIYLIICLLALLATLHKLEHIISKKSNLSIDFKHLSILGNIDTNECTLLVF